MKKWEGGVPGARAEISLQPVVQTVAVSLLLMEVHGWSKDPPAAPGRSHTGEGEECKEPFFEEEGDKPCDKLIAALIPCAPVPLGGRR